MRRNSRTSEDVRLWVSLISDGIPETPKSSSSLILNQVIEGILSSGALNPNRQTQHPFSLNTLLARKFFVTQPARTEHATAMEGSADDGWRSGMRRVEGTGFQDFPEL